MKRLVLSLGLLSLVFSSCARETADITQLPVQDESQLTVQDENKLTAQEQLSQIKSVSTLKYSVPKYDAKVSASFEKQISAMGVKLSPEQFKLIALQRHLKPGGGFASRPAVNLTADQNLTVHFNKHKSQFPGINSKEDYLKSAISYLNNSSPTAQYYFDITSFSKGYQSNVVKWDSKTNELSAVRSNADVTTYYKDGKMNPSRFVIVPPEFDYK